MMVNIFFTYYLISGGVTMFHVHRKYNDIVKAFHALEMVPKELLLLTQFVFGFLVFPIAFPLYIKGMHLKYLNRKLESINRKLKSTNELLEFLSIHKRQIIEEVIQNFSEEGVLDAVTFVFTTKEELVIFPMTAQTDEQYNRMISLIQGKCIEHKGIAVMRIGEAIEPIYDENKNMVGQNNILLVTYETKSTSQVIKLDIGSDKKSIINKRVEPFVDSPFRDYLEKL